MIVLGLMLASTWQSMPEVEPAKPETNKHEIVAPCMSNESDLKFLGWLTRKECHDINGVLPDELKGSQ